MTTVERCRCKCAVCVIPGRCHKTDNNVQTVQDPIQPEDTDVGKLLEQKLCGPDKGAERDGRPPPMCCERIGNGSWCWLVAGHPASVAHEGAKPRMGAVVAPEFATGKVATSGG